jgi:hypothetical protein
MDAPPKRAKRLEEDSSRRTHGDLHAEFSCRRVVNLPDPLLNTQEVRALQLEASTLLSSQQSTDKLLADNGCAFDPMEAVAGKLPPDHSVRQDLDEYLRQRFRSPGPLATLVPEEGGKPPPQYSSNEAPKQPGPDMSSQEEVQQRQALNPPPLEAFRQILCGPLAQAAREVLGTTGTVYLFNEHYVVKPALSEVVFAWHTDENEQLAGAASLSSRRGAAAAGEAASDEAAGGDYGDSGRNSSSSSSYPEYVSIWCALDDTNAANGGLLLRPLLLHAEDPGHADTTTAIPAATTSSSSSNTSESSSAEAEASHPAAATDVVVAEVKAGSAVAFSSRVWHCSGPNTTTSARRVYYAQFSAEPILGRRSVHPLCFAVPLEPTP